MSSLRRRIAKLDNKSSMADFLRARLPDLRADVEAGKLSHEGLECVLALIDALSPASRKAAA